MIFLIPCDFLNSELWKHILSAHIAGHRLFRLLLTVDPSWGVSCQQTHTVHRTSLSIASCCLRYVD
jgi:hypothetical protein